MKLTSVSVILCVALSGCNSGSQQPSGASGMDGSGYRYVAIPATDLNELQSMHIPVYPGAVSPADSASGPLNSGGGLITMLLHTKASTDSVVDYYKKHLEAHRLGAVIPATVSQGNMEGVPTTILTQNHSGYVCSVEIKPDTTGATIQLMRLPAGRMARSIVNTNLHPDSHPFTATMDQNTLP